MVFTYRLSRRLAQIHICALSLISLACRDVHDPTVSSGYERLPSSPVAPGSPLQFSLSRSGSANEPSASVPLSDRVFNARVEAGWRDRAGPHFQIIQNSSAPKSPNGIGKAVFPIGLKGGTAPIQTWYPLPSPKNNLYVSFWIKMSSNWKGHPSHSNKILNFWIDGNNRVVLKARGAGNLPLFINVKMQNVAMSPAAYDLNSNQSSHGSIVRGKWHQVEFLIRANTGSNYDGSMKWWVDGVLAASHSGLRFVMAGQKHQWAQVVWNPVWGGAGDILDQVQDMQIDNVYISGY